jgi:hypothetical protein
MPLTKLPFAPGIFKEGTQYTTGPAWWDCDKIRFRKGRAEQIGGWLKYSSESYMGIARSLYDWTTAISEQYLGIGTNLKFYVEKAQVYYDITPIRLSVAAGTTVQFAATDGSSVITVSHTDHGAYKGDFVTFSGATDLGGNITAAVLNQEYQIDSVDSTNSYTIIAKDTSGNIVVADGSDTLFGGSNVAAEYQINIGTNSYNISLGWGAGAWGESPWGGGGALTFQSQLRLYSQDSFADDLIFNPRIGDIYFWDESASTFPDTVNRAVSLSDVPGANNPPTKALQIMVSPVDRHLIAFGCNDNEFGTGNIDPLLVRWADQESIIEWNPSATNSAGGQPLATGTSFVGAVKTRQEILIFTDTAVHAMRFVGGSFIFSFSVVGENISICSPKAAVSVGDMVFFMDLDGFYVYNGAISRLPCEVLDYVFTNMDTSQAYKVFAVNNPDDSEVTWFYPVGNSPAEITNYVTYNYAERVWTIGTFQRAAWIQAASRGNPLASTADLDNLYTNYIYSHEIGHEGDGEAIQGWLESGQVEIEDGDHFYFIKRYVPDFRFKGTTDSVELAVTLKTTDFPLDPLVDGETKSITATTKQCHVRERARQLAIKIEDRGKGYGWTMGDFRFEMRMDGRR